METLLVIEDGQPLPLQSLQAIYTCQRVSSQELDARIASDARAAILSAHDEAKTLRCANALREVNPALPLLFVADKREAELSLMRCQGYGPIKVLQLHAGDDDQLLHDAQALLHPEYSVGSQRIAIVLPVYNEAGRFENVRNFVAKLRGELAVAYPQISVYFVNDGSKDITQELVEQVIADDANEAEEIHADSPLSAHNLQYNTRKAGTYIQGIKSVRADIVIFADADDSFVIEDIAAMINILQDGYWDMVIGTKDATAEGRSPIRSLMSFVKRLLTKPLLPAGVIDSQTGLKALKGTAAQHIVPYLHESTQLAIDLEMVHIARKLNFRVLQIPVICIDREGSHIDIVRDSIKFMRSIFTIWVANRRVNDHAMRLPQITGDNHV